MIKSNETNQAMQVGITRLARGIMRRMPAICGVLAGAQLAVAAPVGQSNTPVTLRAAIADLMETFGGQYPRGREFLDRLEKLPAGDAAAFAQLQREALVANPLVSGQPILFVNRPEYANLHGPDESMFQSNEENVRGGFRSGGALKLLDAASGVVKTVIACEKGMVRDPDVYFDGSKILFAMRRDARDDFHLYEVGADGGNLKQLTSAPKVSDIQPVYLPNNNIMFSSTREPKYIQCQRHLMANLFVMEGDGANIRQVGHNTLFEGRASLLPDGRVLYSRWEYVDKHFSSAYGLWSVRPDGTAQMAYYGGLAWQPGAIMDGRLIPGTRQVVCVFGSVHGSEAGAMVVVDPERANDGPASVVRSWPPDLTAQNRDWNRLGYCAAYDSFLGIQPKYACPYPLSANYFLCSRTPAGGAGAGLFVVDVFGNEVLLHQEAPGCYQPRPLAPRTRPPVLPEQVDHADKSGVFYVYDVYRGDKMESVKRGSVRSLRVVEAPAKLTYPPNDIGDWCAPDFPDSHHPTAVNWNQYNNKIVLGTVPVEEDGSACFRVPAGKFVYFQLLDEQGMMIHSMRSGTCLQPGERAGCVGCHDYRTPVPAAKLSLALQRQPSDLRPWQGPARAFNYAAEVQPVWDRHCVKCHDFGRKAGRTLNLSGDAGLVFNASYCSLMARSPGAWEMPKDGQPKPLVSTIGAGPVPIVPPGSWGASRSRLIDILRDGHHHVQLSADEMDRVVTWIDLNAPYYPDNADYYSLNTFGRSPLDHGQLLELGKLVLAAPGGGQFGWNNVRCYTGGTAPPGSLMGKGAWPLPVDFTRPECSACLQAFADKSAPGYAQALGIIEAGRKMLESHPRADMPGFEPCPHDRAQLEFHASRATIEADNRAAISAGRKVYD